MKTIASTITITVSSAAQFPRIKRALKNYETLVIRQTRDTFEIENLGLEHWKDGTSRGILFTPREQFELALNGKTLSLNYWGGCKTVVAEKINFVTRCEVLSV